MYRVRPIFKNDHFGEYSNSPKMANFRRVLEFDKFAGEWPLLSKNPISNFWGNPIASFRVGVKLISRTVFHSLKCYVRIIQVKQNQKQSQNRPKIIVELTLIEHPTCPGLKEHSTFENET
jgi:hypothetical protein